MKEVDLLVLIICDHLWYQELCQFWMIGRFLFGLCCGGSIGEIPYICIPHQGHHVGETDSEFQRDKVEINQLGGRPDAVKPSHHVEIILRK